MTEKTSRDDVHEIAGGWITERKGTKVPPVLKLAYIGFSIFGLVYLLMYASGEVGHATRGKLVQQLNAAMVAPSLGFIALVAIVLLAFAAGLVWFAFREDHET